MTNKCLLALFHQNQLQEARKQGGNLPLCLLIRVHLHFKYVVCHSLLIVWPSSVVWEFHHVVRLRMVNLLTLPFKELPLSLLCPVQWFPIFDWLKEGWTKDEKRDTLSAADLFVYFCGLFPLENPGTDSIFPIRFLCVNIVHEEFEWWVNKQTKYCNIK